MPKPNARTFRYSDEVKLILEQHNNDFDALIVEAYLRLPAVKKEVEELEERISVLQEQRSSMWSDIRAMTNIKRQLENIERSLDYVNSSVRNNL